MKAILRIVVLCFFINSVRAQTVNGTPLKDSDLEYIQFVEMSKPMKDSKRVVFYDFGKNRVDGVDKDEKGNSIEDIRAIDALNFLSKSGYELVQTYTVFRSGEPQQMYLMRKKQKREEKK